MILSAVDGLPQMALIQLSGFRELGFVYVLHNSSIFILICVRAPAIRLQSGSLLPFIADAFPSLALVSRYH